MFKGHEKSEVFYIEAYCQNLYLSEQQVGRNTLKGWTWVIFVLGLQAVFHIVHFLVATNDFHYFDFRGVPTHSFRCLFPRCPLQEFDVIHMEMEQTGLATSALLEVWHNRKQVFQLWVLLPLTLFPASHVMFESPYPFRWVPHENFKRLIITDHHSLVYILERKHYSQWVNTQIFETHAPAPFELKDPEEIKTRALRLVKRDWEVENRGLHVSMTPCSRYLLVGNQFSYYLLEESQGLYRFHRLILPEKLQNIQTFNRGLCLQPDGSLWWLVSQPYYQQTTGKVDLYHIPPVKSVDKILTLHTTLHSPHPCSFFGENCVFAPRNLVLISARFAPEIFYGAGAVYVYRQQKGQLVQHQTIRCPRPHQASEQAVLEFGAMFDVSENGDWLIISSQLAGYGSLYIYRYAERLGIYFHMECLSSPDFLLHEVGRSLCIDNHGNLMIGSQKAVYFSWFNERKKVLCPVKK